MEKSWNCVFEFPWEPCIGNSTIEIQVKLGIYITFNSHISMGTNPYIYISIVVACR